MNTTGSTYCDAPTVPETQEVELKHQVSYALPNNYEIGSYKILRVLGEGCCNVSYLARPSDRLEGTKGSALVVIKEYFPTNLAERNHIDELVQRSVEKRIRFEQGKHRFLEESFLLMSTSHPSIVKVNAVFLENGTAYMVSPYYEGETLFEKLRKKGKINQQGLLELFFSISEALCVVHQRGYLHRDLKPSNIFILKNGQPIILDFGASVSIGNGSKSCWPMISQGYTPIEQYSTNLTEQGYWADIYALAAVLYKGVTGLPPVDAVERGQKILKDLEDPYEPLVSIASNQYSLRFLSTIDHALCFRAEDRPQTVNDWCAEFEGTSPVWLAADSVRKELLHQAARRLLDFDLSS